ncbi:acyltransferase family protein [Brevibacterium litoralis]|uniref:acyltransferase family protein n=1 Tax=Brevibacterium litoralis TaxID=3138935 RepID=UPI0032EDACEF
MSTTAPDVVGPSVPPRPATPPRPAHRPVYAERKFRPEVQLLRAVAVLAVVVYHVNPAWLPGGFVGVDVFFVISGYLITAHLLREIERTGTVSLARFWANRARRILPAACVSIVAIALTAPLFLPATQWTATAVQGMASAVYVQNFVLAAKSVDYLTQDAPDTPFQHFWSLSVEEQFYVFWPLVALLALVLVRARVRRNSGGRMVHGTPPGLRRATLVLFGLVVAASFAYSVVTVALGDPAAYFVTPSRVWELGVGGLLACVLGDPVRFPRLRKIGAVLGLLGILLAGVFYTGESFPGVAALLPVLATVLVIASGATVGRGSLGPLVHLRPVQAVGAWSYSLYLWHFPVVVYATVLLERDPNLPEGLLLVAFSLLLSWASYRWIETPVRNDRALARRSTLALTASVTAVAVAAAVSIVPQAVFASHVRAEDARSAQVVAAVEDQAEDPVDGEPTDQETAEPEPEIPWGAASLGETDYDTFVPGQDEVIVPNPADVRGKDAPVFPEECSGVPAKAGADSVTECVVANPDGERTFVVVGDSHAAQWVPAIEKAVEGTEWRLVVFLRNSCPFTTAQRGWEGKGLNCLDSNEQVLERILEIAPEKVLMTNLAFDDIEGVPGEEHPGEQGYLDTMRPMAEAGAQIYVLEDTPRPDGSEDTPTCVVRHREDPETCGFPRDEGSEGRYTNPALESAAGKVDGAEFLSLGDRFCTEDFCPAVIGNLLVYRDENHVGRTYMETLAPDVAQAFDLTETGTPESTPGEEGR